MARDDRVDHELVFINQASFREGLGESRASHDEEAARLFLQVTECLFDIASQELHIPRHRGSINSSSVVTPASWSQQPSRVRLIA